jgi:hypothetical protein
VGRQDLIGFGKEMSHQAQTSLQDFESRNIKEEKQIKLTTGTI